MFLLFPNLQMLQLALTSGLIPESIAAAPVEFAAHEDGRTWVQISLELEPSAAADLKALGVAFRKSTRGASSALQTVACWPQLLPLEKMAPAQSASPNGLTARTPVLFVLPKSANLAEVVSEMLRLGNDRQSFRQQETPAGTRTLLQVKGPPYYTLLRAIDSKKDQDAPQAFIEQQPRVWVEYGYSHPLAESIQPAAGTFLLLGRPREWTVIEEGKFRDIYELLRFKIPGKPIRWETEELKDRLKVPLRLVRGGSEESAELWVLSESGLSQLEELVSGADDRLISRLAFAVGTSPHNEGQKVVAVKVRPGKEPPPVLVLDGVACRRYLRIPNLFLPVGYRLHPPLRRDAVKQLLASEADLDTWLLQGSDGQFVPQSLPDDAFRPLSDWVDYVLDSHRDALMAWKEGMQFDFESFICPDEEPHRERKVSKPETAEPGPTKPSPIEKKAAEPKPKPKPAVRSPQQNQLPARKVEVIPPSELQQKLQMLEAEFREMPEPLDSPLRRKLWRELAETHIALGNKSEAAVCYASGLWSQQALSADWIRDWFQAEAAPPAEESFQAAISTERPTPAQLHQLAIHAIHAAFGETNIPPAIQNSLGRVQQQLERYENYLPVKIAWLAWLACVKLAGHDFLTLARTRDRLLERLHQQGPSPDLDLPGFLRSSGPREGGRFRAVQAAMQKLRDRVQAWIRRELEERGIPKAETASYADLMIAYGYSRVGLATECQALLEKTQAHLASQSVSNEVHAWLSEAFRFRIEQASAGKSRSGSLPEVLMKPLIEKTLDANAVYIIDSLRAKSKILEPYEQIRRKRGLSQGDKFPVSRRKSNILPIWITARNSRHGFGNC